MDIEKAKKRMHLLILRQETAKFLDENRVEIIRRVQERLKRIRAELKERK